MLPGYTRAVDLTHPVNRRMSLYPGTEPPRLEPAATVERDGYRETSLSLCSHVGTHMDAPAHICRDALTLDALPVGRFFGTARLLDCRSLSEGEITAAQLDTLPLDELDFLLLRTGYEQLWGDRAYYGHFPTLSPDGAELLASSPISGIGVDAISVDPIDITSIHKILLGAGKLLIENLCNLDALPADRPFSLCVLPLYYENADGSPARAVALL